MRQDPIVRAFDRRAATLPGRTLVVSPSRRATVAEVDARARAAAARLAEAGLPPGSAVAVAVSNGPALLATLIALRRLGLVALLTDARGTATEHDRVARHLGASAIVRCSDPWADEPADFAVESRPAIAAGFPPDTAFVKMSSGSTGLPRGIATPSEALLADDDALVRTMGIADDDVLVAAIPMTHSYGLSSLAVPALVRGIALALPDPAGPLAPLGAARAAGATVFPTVPAYLAALVRMGDPPELPDTVRTVITAGAPLAGATSAWFRERFGRPVHVFYGASECGGITYDRDGGAAERGTVGAPIEGVAILLEALEDDDDARSGRVVVRSPAVASGYVPEPDPALDGVRFATGDLASWRGGELALAGRLDDLVNVRGHKVNPREVEAVIGAIGEVDDVLVVGVPDPDGRDPVLRAFVASGSRTLDRERVLAWCRGRLADHKVPRSVVVLDEIPRTARGKIDRDALGRPGG